MHPSQAAIQQELSAISPDDRTDRTVTLNGTDLRMRYAPEPGIDMRIHASDPEDPGAEVVSTVFEPAAERPASYPPDLPYLPGLKASVMTSPEGTILSVTWFMVPDAERVGAEAVAQSTAAGWIESTEPGEHEIPGIGMIELRRGGRERSVIVSSFGEHTMVALIERAADEG